MENYQEVQVERFVKEGIENGTMKPFVAIKYARIIARKGTVGEEVISWSVDENGKELKEKVDQVSLDDTTKEPGWIVTKTSENGEVILDENGHPNEWIISDSKFKSKYEIDSENPGLYKPVGGPQIFVEIPVNITLEQWGSKMNIAAGGFINITNPSDMYGISKRDFEDTYKIIDEPIKTKKLV